MKSLFVTIGLLLIYTTASIYLSDLSEDHEFVNRTGAILSALGALLVVYQALVETKIEHRRSSEAGMMAGANLSPANTETAQKIFRERAAARTRWRIQIIVCIALVVFVGEVLHGFGDLLGSGLRFLPGRSTSGHLSKGSHDGNAVLTNRLRANS